jgi:transposase
LFAHGSDRATRVPPSAGLRGSAEVRLGTTGYRAMLRFARQWPQRIWAVEGAGGVGRPVAQRLLADGERALDVPAKLTARARVFDTGQGRKTDATDVPAVVMVALRDRGLRGLSVDADRQVPRLLCDRRLSTLASFYRYCEQEQLMEKFV